MSSSLKAIKDFVRDGGDVNDADSSGHTLLSEISWNPKKRSSIKFLLEKGANPNHRNRNGTSVVTTVQYMEILRLFVRHGASLENVDSIGSNYAHYATCMDTLEYARSLGVDLTARNQKGKSPLHEYHERCLRLGGVDPSVADYLLQAGNNVNDADSSGKTIFHSPHTADIERLVAIGADFKQTDNMGRNCFHYNVKRGYILTHSINIYLAQGVDINAKDVKGKTPLHLSKQGWISGCLIKNGASKNALDNQGRTVLHYATLDLMSNVLSSSKSIKCSVDNIKDLIVLGVDVNVVDKNGDRCLDEFIPMIHKYSPSSKNGAMYYEILRLALSFGLDIGVYGKYVYDLVEHPTKGPKMDPLLVEKANTWVRLYTRYNLVFLRRSLDDNKRQRVSGPRCGYIRSTCGLGDDLFRNIVGYI